MTGPSKVSNRGAAELMNVTPATWRSAVSAGKAPAPDGREEVSGNPWWFATTVTTYRDNRPGMGTRPGHGRRAHGREANALTPYVGYWAEGCRCVIDPDDQSVHLRGCPVHTVSDVA